MIVRNVKDFYFEANISSDVDLCAYPLGAVVERDVDRWAAHSPPLQPLSPPPPALLSQPHNILALTPPGPSSGGDQGLASAQPASEREEGGQTRTTGVPGGLQMRVTADTAELLYTHASWSQVAVAVRPTHHKTSLTQRTAAV